MDHGAAPGLTLLSQRFANRFALSPRGFPGDGSVRRLLISIVFGGSFIGGLVLFRDAGTALMAAGLVGSAAALQPEPNKS